MRIIIKEKLEVCHKMPNFQSSIISKRIYTNQSPKWSQLKSAPSTSNGCVSPSLDVQGEEHRFHRYHRCDDGDGDGGDALKALYPELNLNL